MKGLRFWNLICWVAALLVVVPLTLKGAFTPSSLNYGHYEELRLIALLFLLHAASFTLILEVLKKVVKEPPLPPPPESGPSNGEP